MVNEKVLIKDKHRVLKKTIKILIIVFVIIFILLIAVGAGFFLKKPTLVEVNFANPIEHIILANTNLETGIIDKEVVIEEAIFEFNEDYINYILAALGTGYLHKSILGGDPVIELNLEEEIWHAKIVGGIPESVNQETDKEDLRVIISKEEAVKAILSEDIEQFMKDSVNRGDIQLELVASKAELFTKGYLDMYKRLTGEEVSVE